MNNTERATLVAEDARDTVRNIIDIAMNDAVGFDQGMEHRPWPEILDGATDAAMQAAAPHGDDLDAMLDSVHKDALISGMWNPPMGTSDYIAEIGWPHPTDHNGDWPSASGYGPTRTAAIADAVAKAKEARYD